MGLPRDRCIFTVNFRSLFQALPDSGANPTHTRPPGCEHHIIVSVEQCCRRRIAAPTCPTLTRSSPCVEPRSDKSMIGNQICREWRTPGAILHLLSACPQRPARSELGEQPPAARLPSAALPDRPRRGALASRQPRGWHPRRRSAGAGGGGRRGAERRPRARAQNRRRSRRGRAPGSTATALNFVAAAVIVLLCIDAQRVILWDLPGDVLAAPASALSGWTGVISCALNTYIFEYKIICVYYTL